MLTLGLYSKLNKSGVLKSRLTCCASISDWKVMYQLLLWANSALNALGQLSLLNRASTSCERDGTNTSSTHTRSVLTCNNSLVFIVTFTSTGVVSGTSLRMMIQRLWFGRTFSPVSSTCTRGEAVREKCCHILEAARLSGSGFRSNGPLLLFIYLFFLTLQ